MRIRRSVTRFFTVLLVPAITVAVVSYFGAYAITVVGSRFFLAPTLTKADSNRIAVLLLVMMSLGVGLAFGFTAGVLVQLASATTLGLGYGLAYSIIQTQTVNDAPSPLRSAALTWFVIAYFIGIFGFPMLGGWLIVLLATSGFSSSFCLSLLPNWRLLSSVLPENRKKSRRRLNDIVGGFHRDQLFHSPGSRR